MGIAKDVLTILKEEWNPDDFEEKMERHLRQAGWKHEQGDFHIHPNRPGHKIEIKGSHIVHHKPDGSKEPYYGRYPEVLIHKAGK